MAKCPGPGSACLLHVMTPGTLGAQSVLEMLSVDKDDIIDSDILYIIEISKIMCGCLRGLPCAVGETINTWEK